MFPVVGEKRDAIAQGDGGDSHIRVGKGLTFLPPVAPQ
jgi:hypothetical protein